MSEPFLAKIPQKYLGTIEEREFWEYLTRFIGSGSLEGVIEENISDLFAGIGEENEDQEQALQVVFESAVFRAISQSGGTFEALDRDYINASNNLEVLLPLDPPEAAVVKVRNADGSLIRVDGSGRTINNLGDFIEMRRQNSTFDYYYFIDDDSWNIG